jgi:hypothetical protein
MFDFCDLFVRRHTLSLGMSISRRSAFMLLAAGALRASTIGNGGARKVWRRRYRASATIMLLSIPVVTKNDVGSGFTVIEETEGGLSIQFGAGSWPESARGLNRLGYIEEKVVENRAGELAESSYFAFMTTSAEKNTEQAMRALESHGPAIPYVAAEAAGRNGTFASTVSRIELPSRITWRDYPAITDQVRSAILSAPETKHVERALAAGEAAPATFLYAVRSAMLSPKAKTSGSLIYNGKEFLLHTEKVKDTWKGLGVIRLGATLHDTVTGVNTPFRVWYEAGSEHLPPLRFEYQAKSFLRLAFEYDPPANTSKENA